MTLKSILKTTVAAAALVGLSAVIPVAATDFSGSATVTIVEGIIITQDDPLRFGNILKPTSGSQTFTMSETGTATPGAGDGSFIGPASLRGPGQYDVNGTNGATYDFSVAAGACTDAALTLGSMTDDAGATPTLDDLDVHVGGTLTVASTVSSASYTCAYTVTANYS